MPPLRATLDAYEPYDHHEADAVARLRRVLDGGDGWSRSLPLHATASALVVHPPTGRVLLRWHPRLDGWFQVGGHGDPGETDPWLIARREAEEETGLHDLTAPAPALERRPVQIVAVPVPATEGDPGHEHVDIRYVLATATPDAVRAEASDAAVRWFTFAAAWAQITEPNLRTFVRRVEQLLPARGD